MDNTIIAKNRELIKEHFHINDFALNAVEGEIERLNQLPPPVRHPFFYHALLALLTNVLYPLMGLKRNIESDNDDFVFISCNDSFFRTKTIGLITGPLKYCIIYLPTFHVPSAFKYQRYFKRHGTRVFFPTIKLKYVFLIRSKIRSLSRKLEGLGKDSDSRRAINVLSQFLIYDCVVKNYLKQLDTFKGKWILEHQKFFFIPAVTNLQEKGFKSTMLQHTVFFKPHYDFIPLICDDVLCCSERERSIYIESGVEPDRVVVLGASLQNLETDEESSSTSPQRPYRLLLALSIIDEKTIGLTKSILSYIKQQQYGRVLVRFRPRSRNNDIELLKDCIEGFDFSPASSTLTEDIGQCDKVITFSANANFEIMRMKRQFLYVRFDKDQGFVSEMGFVTEDNYQDEISKLMESDTYSTFTMEQYKDVFGESDIEVLRNRFASYIQG